jgi:hypothetical protein
VSLEPDCEDASYVVRASGLPFVLERYVAKDGSTGDGFAGETLLPVPGSPVPSVEDLQAPKSRSVSESGLDSESDSSYSDLDFGFVPGLGPGSVPPPRSVGMVDRPSSSTAQSKESRSHFLSETCSLDSTQAGFGLTKS